MAWRTGHGDMKGTPRIEVMPADELPRAHGKEEGRGGATKVRLARRLMDPTGDPTWIPYAKLAEQFRRAQCKAVARQAGGRCGIAPSSIVASAALQLALSRWMLDKAVSENDPALVKNATGLMNDSRQNLMAAYELAIRECQARAKYEKDSPHVALEKALGSNETAPRLGRPRLTPHVVELRTLEESTTPGDIAKTSGGPEIIDALVDVPVDK